MTLTSPILLASSTISTVNVTNLPSTTVQPDLSQPNKGTIFLVALISAVSFLIIFVTVMLFYLRKKRLDKLRHQLMPFYSFDPHEEDGDWESDLLEDNTLPKSRIDYKSLEFSRSGVPLSKRL